MISALLQSAHRPTEIHALLRLALREMGKGGSKKPLHRQALHLQDLEFCYAALDKVSRSFAAVIRQLPEELRDAVCVFYLVLRGLDSVEDDMRIPLEEKLDMLRSFYHNHSNPGWKLSGVGDSEDYRSLLQNYPKVAGAFLGLAPAYQEPITRVCREMGNGMADFAEKPLISLADYDLYCHYVAGLVGEGLSELFAASGKESAGLRERADLANSMGLFLQKTNIIRDYHEDLHSDRTFWPEEIWGKYSSELADFERMPNSRKSLSALNQLVTDALRHVPDCLAYLDMLRDPRIFRFCAIPQLMAIATLAELYNNPRVFSSVVKIRKGLAATLIENSDNLDQVRETFLVYVRQIQDEIDLRDPNCSSTIRQLHKIAAIANGETPPEAKPTQHRRRSQRILASRTLEFNHKQP